MYSNKIRKLETWDLTVKSYVHFTFMQVFRYNCGYYSYNNVLDGAVRSGYIRTRRF